MNPEIKQKWVNALRSGEFKQGKSSLMDGAGKACCLGVLCEIAVNEGIVERILTSSGDYFGYVAPGTDPEFADADADVAVLPQEVKEWAGLNDSNPEITVNGRREVAAMHNDSLKHTFVEIAQGIEDSL